MRIAQAEDHCVWFFRTPFPMSSSPVRGICFWLLSKSSSLFRKPLKQTLKEFSSSWRTTVVTVSTQSVEQ